MFDGLEMGIFPLVARPALQDLLGGASDEDVATWMGRITALFLVGAALGGLVFGWLGDRIGRVRALSWSILTYSLFTGACWFATAPWNLGALRCVAALGMGGEWSLGVALVMESWPRKSHPMLAGVISAACNFGFAVIAVVGMVFPVSRDSWRWVMLTGTVPALLTFFIRRRVPESARWEHARHGADVRPVAEIFGPVLRRRTLLAIAFASIALIGTWGSVQWLPIWADQMTGGLVPRAKAITQLLSALGAVAGGILGGWMAGRMGRRQAFFAQCTGALGMTALLFRGGWGYGPAFLALVFLTGCATTTFYGLFPLYFAELFPTHVRATGQGVSYNFGRLFAAAGALGTGTLIAGMYGGSYARAGASLTLVYAVGLVLIWMAPETRGSQLKD